MNYHLIKIYLFFRNKIRIVFHLFKSVSNWEKAKHTYTKWIDCNKKIFSENITSNHKMILCDVFMVPEWLFVNSFAINELCKYHNCISASYGNISRNRTEHFLYSSFGVKKHLIVKLFSCRMKKRHKLLFEYAKQNICSKEQLFNFEIEGVQLGIDIYESILRTGVPTVDVNSFRTWQNIYIGLEYYVYFESLYREDKIQALMLSHDNYIYMGIPSKLGFKYDIPTYLFNSREFIKLIRSNQLHDRFNQFPFLFDQLNDSEKEKAILWSKSQLVKRLNGNVGVEMEYQEKSAFTKENVKSEIVSNGKTNIVVATHEFYDNPHGYGGLLFLDFYEWLVFLGEFSKESDYNWYIKPHRDAAESELKQLKKIVKKYKKFTLLNKEYTFHQLYNEEVRIALTCYGTIGHELPLLGFKVINAGNNPHMAYNFNFHPKSLEEYTCILNNLNQLKIEINNNEIYEFFFTYKKIIYSIDYSVKNFYPLSVNRSSNIILDFIKCSDEFEKSITNLLKKFIISEKTYSFQLTNNTI